MSNEHSISESDALQTEMATLYRDRSQAEVEIITSDGTTERVHQLILTMRSEVFKTMFAVPMSEASTLRVHMRTTPATVVKAFVKFLYTDDIGVICFATASELYALSHQYQMKGLQAQCSQHMENLMDSDTVIALLSTGDLYDDQSLRKIALAYITNHASALLHDVAFGDHMHTYIADRHTAKCGTLATKSSSTAKTQVQELLQVVASAAVVTDVGSHEQEMPRKKRWVESSMESLVQFLYSIDA